MAQRIKIPSSGDTTPEYVAVQRSFTEIDLAVEAISRDFTRQAHSSRLIPRRNPEDHVMDVVLTEISRDPINYYVLQHVLVTLNMDDRFDKSISKMDKAFLGEIKKYIPEELKTELVPHAGQTKKEPDHPEVFISFSRRTPYGDSPDAHAKAIYLHTQLKDKGCKPWMDEKGLLVGDVLVEEIFPVVKHCRAILPILTAGYATSLWCLRELYYATLQQPKKLFIPMLLGKEEDINSEKAGNWLMRIGTAQKYFKKGQIPDLIKALKDHKIAAAKKED